MDQPTVRLCCSKFAGHNRLVVVDDFAIESSFDPSSGYSRNIVSYDKAKIQSIALEVEAFCKGAFCGQDAIDEIQRRFDTYKQERR